MYIPTTSGACALLCYQNRLDWECGAPLCIEQPGLLTAGQSQSEVSVLLHSKTILHQAFAVDETSLNQEPLVRSLSNDENSIQLLAVVVLITYTIVQSTLLKFIRKAYRLLNISI